MSTITLNIPITATALQTVEQHTGLLLEKFTIADYQQLQAVVFDSLSDKDGAPQIGHLVISHFTLNNDNMKGKFRVSFQIERQFCCSDTSACQSDYIDFDYSYNANVLAATGQFINWNMDN